MPVHDRMPVPPRASLMPRLDTLITLNSACVLPRPRDTLMHMPNLQLQPRPEELDGWSSFPATPRSLADSAGLAEPRGVGASGMRNVTEASAWGREDVPEDGRP